MKKRAGLSCDGSKGNIQARYELKNGVYEGGLVKYRRSGVGIALLDEGTITLGQWQNDLLHGRALVFDPKFGLILGNFSKGAQTGKQLVRLNSSPNTIYFVEVKDESKLPTSFIEYSLNEGTASIIDKTKNECAETFLSKSLRELLNEFVHFDIQEFSHLITKKEAKSTIEIGFRRDSLLSGFAFTINLRTFDLTSAGFFEKGKLEGLGRLVLSNKDVFEGLFKEGKISGKGFYYESAKSCYTYGVFSEGKVQNLINTYTSYPLVQMKKFKSTIHEGSLNYYSNTFPSFGLIRSDWSYLNQHTPLAPLSPPQSEQVIQIPSQAFSKHTPTSSKKQQQQQQSDDFSDEIDNQPIVTISQFPSFPQQATSNNMANGQSPGLQSPYNCLQQKQQQFKNECANPVDSFNHNNNMNAISPISHHQQQLSNQQHNPNEALMLLYSNQYQTFQQQSQFQPQNSMRDSSISMHKTSLANFHSDITSSPLLEHPIQVPATQNRSNSRKNTYYTRTTTDSSAGGGDKYSEKYNHLFMPAGTPSSGKPPTSSSQVIVDFGKLSNLNTSMTIPSGTSRGHVKNPSQQQQQQQQPRSFVNMQSESTPESKRRQQQQYHPTSRMSTEQNTQSSTANYFFVNNTLMHSSELPKYHHHHHHPAGTLQSAASTVDSQYFLPAASSNSFQLNKCTNNSNNNSNSERMFTPSKKSYNNNNSLSNHPNYQISSNGSSNNNNNTYYGQNNNDLISAGNQKISLNTIIKQAYNNHIVPAANTDGSSSIYQISLPASMIPTKPNNNNSNSSYIQKQLSQKSFKNGNNNAAGTTLADLVSPKYSDSFAFSHPASKSTPQNARDLILTPPASGGYCSPTRNATTPEKPQGKSLNRQQSLIVRDTMPITHNNVILNQCAGLTDQLDSTPRYRQRPLSKENQQRLPWNFDDDPNWNPASNHSYQEVASEHDEGEPVQVIIPVENRGITSTTNSNQKQKIPPFTTGIFDLNRVLGINEDTDKRWLKERTNNHLQNMSSSHLPMMKNSNHNNNNNNSISSNKAAVLATDENEPYNYRNKSVVRFSFIKEKGESLPRESSASPFNNTKIKNPEKSSLKQLQMNQQQQAGTNRTSSINLTTARTTMTEQQHLASMCNDQFRISPQRPSRKALAELEARSNSRKS